MLSWALSTSWVLVRNVSYVPMLLATMTGLRRNRLCMIETRVSPAVCSLVLARLWNLEVRLGLLQVLGSSSVIIGLWGARCVLFIFDSLSLWV